MANFHFVNEVKSQVEIDFVVLILKTIALPSNGEDDDDHHVRLSVIATTGLKKSNKVSGDLHFLV